jgi:glutathione S-transferase
MVQARSVLMKLYFAPGACSLSPHIVLREAGYNFDLEHVDNKEKKTKSGKDFWGINGKGQVPVLELDNGERITEGPAIVRRPEARFRAGAGQRQHGARARAGMAQFHNIGAP